MAAGKAVVASNGGALPELVEDGQNGRLFEPGNAEQLASILEEVLRNPQEREHFGAVSLERVTHHELELSLGLYATLYLECREKQWSAPSLPSSSESV